MNNQLTTERLEIMLAETLGITAARAELASIEVNASIFICVLTEVLASRKNCQPVGEDELDHLIWGLERYGLYPRQLAALKELRERRKDATEPVADVVPWSSPNEERTCDIRWRRFDVAPGPLFRASPDPEVLDTTTTSKR